MGNQWGHAEEWGQEEWGPRKNGVRVIKTRLLAFAPTQPLRPHRWPDCLASNCTRSLSSRNYLPWIEQNKGVRDLQRAGAHRRLTQITFGAISGTVIKK